MANTTDNLRELMMGILLAPWRSELGRVQAEAECERDAWLASARTEQEWTADERAEYNDLLDLERDEYWSTHCPAHSTPLEQDGTCTVCQAELSQELRDDA